MSNTINLRLLEMRGFTNVSNNFSLSITSVMLQDDRIENRYKLNNSLINSIIINLQNENCWRKEKGKGK
jgi:hypothetical protein